MIQGYCCPGWTVLTYFHRFLRQFLLKLDQFSYSRVFEITEHEYDDYKIIQTIKFYIKRKKNLVKLLLNFVYFTIVEEKVNLQE